MQKIILDTNMAERSVVISVVMLDILCRLFNGEPKYSAAASSLNHIKTDPMISAIKDSKWS